MESIYTYQALKGKTPAEKAGIDLRLDGNKWEELIRRGSRVKKEAIHG